MKTKCTRYLYTYISRATGLEFVLGAYASDENAQKGAYLFSGDYTAPLRQHVVQPGERIVRGSRYVVATPQSAR